MANSKEKSESEETTFYPVVVGWTVETLNRLGISANDDIRFVLSPNGLVVTIIAKTAEAAEKITTKLPHARRTNG